MVLFALRYHSKQDIVISGHIYSGALAIRIRHESIKHADCRDTTCIDKTLFNKHFMQLSHSFSGNQSRYAAA